MAVMVTTTTVVVGVQQESVEELRAKAEQGNADAQSRLGVMCRQGQGVISNDKANLSYRPDNPRIEFGSATAIHKLRLYPKSGTNR